jgi:hypothetical protein
VIKEDTWPYKEGSCRADIQKIFNAKTEEIFLDQGSSDGEGGKTVKVAVLTPTKSRGVI